MAGQGGGGAQEPGKDNSYFILWLLFLIGLVCAVIWWTLHEQLKMLLVYVRLFELEVVAFFVNLLPVNLIPTDWFDVASFQSKVRFDQQFAENLNPKTLTLNQARYISERAGQYMLYPLSIVMAGVGLFYYFSNIHMRFKHKFNMRSLLAKEKELWPQVKIAYTLDILKEDLESGPWAMSQTPMQYAKQHGLTIVEEIEKHDTQFSKMKTPDYKVTLDRIRAERVLAAQLGRIWRGVEAMPPYRRAIFAVFAARGARDTKTAQNLVKQLSSSAASGQVDCSGADELWKKHISHSGV